uniref:Uncharacterized protein n=1 Tax=Nelumbo nucifera TaxID=4432 RepID=A0A822ZSH2_NELNU|nr:TPA_asm: hypothetical protein HUJ06_018129 [Nelumbo nucifera]
MQLALGFFERYYQPRCRKSILEKSKNYIPLMSEKKNCNSSTKSWKNLHFCN